MLGSFPLGSTTIPGILSTGSGTVPVVEPTPQYLQIKASGEFITDSVVADSVNLSLTLNNQGKLSFTCIGTEGTHHFNLGEPIELLWNSNKIFGGFIDVIEEELLRFGNPPLVHNLECSDYSKLFDRIYISCAYNQKTIYQIITSIINTETTLGSLDGITIGDIPHFLINDINFSFKKVSECISDLCDYCELKWRVTADKVFEVYDQLSSTAPFNIGDGDQQNYRNLVYSRTLNQYRNAQWVRAGKGKTSLMTEYFSGDADIRESKRRRTFTLAYPVASHPVITRNGVTQAVGQKNTSSNDIRRVTEPDGPPMPGGMVHWFYEYGEKEITQNSTDDEVYNPTLASNESLKVVYNGYYPIIVYTSDNYNILSRQTIEGGSGIYESLNEDDSLDSQSLASSKATRLLTQFGTIPGILEYEIDEYGLLPGHIQHITLSGHNVSSSFTIREVKISFPRYDYIRCEVNAINGGIIDGWTEWWKKADSSRKSKDVDNESIIKTAYPKEIIGITDVVRILLL